MKFCILLLVFVVAIIIGECSHFFIGSSSYKEVVYHRRAVYPPKKYRNRVETIEYSLPDDYGYGRTIKGILAIDLTNSGANATVKEGGIGYTYMTLRMKSDIGQHLRYDVYVYA